MAAHLDHGFVADAQPEDEPIWVGFRERLGRRVRRPRVPDEDVGDAGGYHQAFGSREEQRGVGECLSSQSLTKPQRGVPQFLEF